MKRVLIVVLSFLLLTVTNAQELDKSKAFNLIQQNAATLNISVTGDDIPKITNAYTDSDLGLTYIYAQQNYKGIKVFNVIKTTVFKQNVLQSNMGDFVENIASKANIATPTIAAIKAVTLAAKHLNLTDVKNLYEIENTFNNNKQIIFSPAAIAKKNITAELVWVYNEEKKTVQLAWNIGIDVLNSSDYWNVRVDAATGNFIEKNNYTVYENHNTTPTKNIVQKKSITKKNIKSIVNKTVTDDQVLTAATTTATYNVIPYPKESYLYSNPVLETNPWLKAGVGNNATTNGWHYDGFTDYDITRGNNVYAYDDSLKQDFPGRSPSSTTSLPVLTFNSTFTKTKQPYTTANREFATTNLFYWNNIMHDISYQYGFTEVAGNFQADNIGRGGQENDYVNAEAQDGSGTDNANFRTDPDGISGRMQMYLFTYTNPKRDGDLDNAVISHEYTHGISNRLTGGPSNTSCLYNYEQGGEGWSDYVALMVTTNWATAKITDGIKSRSVGNYLKGQSATGFGFRTFPYSTDMSVNFHTYADVSNNAGYPQRDINNNIIPNVTEVHYIGEVWCSALWDMTWNIIQQIGYATPNLYDATGTGGNIIALKLVMQGLKFQKCSPGFLDSRNAILKADSVLYGNLYHAAIWDAFARRGMGYTSTQGLSTKTNDQTDAYDAPIFTIDGRFITPLLKPIPNSLLWEKKNNFYWRLTDSAAGYYQLSAYRNGVRTYFGAKKNETIKNNGVSSIDVILTQNHILNKVKLNSPYKIIAADVSNDKTVSNFDVIYMKRLILGIDTTFVGNRLWAFVDSAYQFPNTTNPFPYKDSISFTNLTANKTNQTFIGVKLGDVNYDWNPAQVRGVALNNVELIIDNEAIKVDKQLSTINYQLPIKVKNFKDLVAMQYTLHFNHNLYDFVAIENNKLGIEFNKEQANKTGNISFLWTSAKSIEKTLDDGTEIFSLSLKRKWEMGNSELDIKNMSLEISNDITEIEAWDKDYQQHNIILSQKETTINHLPLTINNWFVSPNPNDGNIVINLNSNSNKNIQFELTNAVGKTIYTQSFEVLKGNNNFPLNLNTKSKLASGVYFIKIIGLTENNVKRIVVN